MHKLAKMLKWNVVIFGSALLAGCVTQNHQASGGLVNVGAEVVAQTIAEWIEPYQILGITTNQEGCTTYLYSTLGKFPLIFDRLQLTFAIDAEAREVVCYGFLPTVVPDNRRKDMVEFIFRGEWGYGISPASMVLDDGGEVRCQAWIPFESFVRQPKETKWRLMGTVVDKLLSFSDGVATVALGGDPAIAVDKIRRIAAFEGLDEAVELKKAADVDTKIVLERCFERDSEVEVGAIGDKWLEKLSGNGSDVHVGIINARFEDVVRDVGGRYDVLPYSLVVREGMVWNVCCIPESCPPEAIGKVADVLMEKNQKLKYSLYSIDFDTGKIWCHCSLPVSVLPDGHECRTCNLYDVLLKTIPIRSVACDSEELRSAMLSMPQQADGDGRVASTKGRVGEVVSPVALPLLTKMLNAYDVWEADSWDLSNTSLSGTATKKRIADRRYMKYCDDGVNDEVRCKAWPFEVDEIENRLSQKMTCDKNGLYCVLGECNDYDEGIMDDGNVAINPSVRWMNRNMEEWATNALDGMYGRLPEDKMVKMLGEDSINDGTFCWAVGTNEYFIIQRIEEDHAFESRDYIYMLWDGMGEPMIAATFNSLPNSQTMYAVRSCMAGDPVGRNNMAALMWNEVADRGEKDDEKIRRFLEAAKKAGVAVAVENLDIMEETCTR